MSEYVPTGLEHLGFWRGMLPFARRQSMDYLLVLCRGRRCVERNELIMLAHDFHDNERCRAELAKRQG